MTTRLRWVWTGPLGSAVAVATALIPAAPAVADSCDNAQYRTGASAALPDCRAYEQVSPRQKFGQRVWLGIPTAGAGGDVAILPGWSADDGGTVLFSTSAGPSAPDPTRGFGAYPQTAARSTAGWSSQVVPGSVRPETVVDGRVIQHYFMQPNRERTGALFTSGALLTPEQPIGGGTSPGVFFSTAARNTWVSQPPWDGAVPPPSDPLLYAAGAFAPVGQSDDGSTFFFMTRQVVTPEDVASGRTWANEAWAMYRWRNGQVRNVGVLPSGTVDPLGTMSPGMTFLGSGTAARIGDAGRVNFIATFGSTNLVSRDGRRALFLGGGNAPTRIAQLYLYREGQPTLLLSKRADQSNPIAGTDGVVPIGIFSASSNPSHNANGTSTLTAIADDDLDVVLFSTRDALTDDAPVDANIIKTYRYSVDTGGLVYLAEFNRSGAGSSRTSTGNVVRMSDDGSRILFWTPAGELKLWRNGASTLTLATGLETSGAVSTLGARFSSDARTVVFQSTRAIGAEPNHPPGNGTSQTQIYRFDEAVDGTTPRCVSCPPPSIATRGPATFDLSPPYSAGFGAGQARQTSAAETRAISSNGRRVYFTTNSTLDPRDQNAVADVYEWSADRGTAVLLSSGSPGSQGSALLDFDATGDNVFFVTGDALTGSDVDNLTDVYVARVNGGLPDPDPLDEERACSVSDCQAPSPPGPQLLGPGSGAVGTVAEGARDVGATAPRSFAVRRSRASLSKATVGVTVPGPGTIRVSGKGVRSASRRVSRSSTYTMHVRLTSHTRRRAARLGRTSVALRVRFSPRSGKAQAETVRVTVKRSLSTKRGGN